MFVCVHADISQHALSDLLGLRACVCVCVYGGVWLEIVMKGIVTVDHLLGSSHNSELRMHPT